MARQRHLYTFNGVHLELRFTYKYKSWYTHVTITIPTKKSPGTKSGTQQEVGYFEFSLQILCNFCHFQVSYFNELLLEINSDQHQIWSV